MTQLKCAKETMQIFTIKLKRFRSILGGWSATGCIWKSKKDKRGAMDAWNEGGKNRWRYKEGSDQKVIEIELTQGKVAWIDAERLEEVQQHKWHVYTGGGYCKVFYARTEVRKKGEKHAWLYMHVFLFPDVKAPRDHIDHDGLNNTFTNIRSGYNGINQRNTKRESKTTGVSEDVILKRYVAHWTDIDGRNVRKIFSWSKYPTKEDAYEAAVAYRKTNSEHIIKKIESINATDEKTMPEKYVKKQKKRSNSGIEHIIIRKNSKSSSVVVNYTANRKTSYKIFPGSEYNHNLDLAIEAAKEWLEEAKKQNPKKRKTEDK